ncbi:MAG: hypothetical protein QNJ45_13180 [Ardenticatenaceae bacterium]|nr:hypothetical protein [Ardenticatenaceae bacterium]
MDHVVYLDAKAGEMENLLSGKKTMIIRGAAGRKMPYGRVHEGDVLFFINNNAEGVIRGKGRVSSVMNSEKLSKDASKALVEENQDKLQLTPRQFKRWAGKRYIVLIEVEAIESVEPFPIDKRDYGNMDDWLPVGDIASVSSHTLEIVLND